MNGREYGEQLRREIRRDLDHAANLCEGCGALTAAGLIRKISANAFSCDGVTENEMKYVNALVLERTAQLIAHRGCCGSEHDPANGKLHGCCVVCGVPWPCEYAGKPPAVGGTTDDGPTPQMVVAGAKIFYHWYTKMRADNLVAEIYKAMRAEANRG